MQQEAAQTVALQALTWILGDPATLEAFLGATGVSAGDLGARAREPEFHGAILDFLLMDDQWVIGFCDASGHAYTVPMAARTALPGGQQEHWT